MQMALRVINERAVMHRVHSWLLSMGCVLYYSCVCVWSCDVCITAVRVCGRVMCVVLQLCVCVVV